MLIDSAVITGSILVNNTNVSSITNVAGFATTGSNQFNGNQSISGSITSNGTITAQTLVVQTVTSSVEFVTGSTRNGSLASNTHEFTGSVGITGSATTLFSVNNSVLFISSSGNIGMGTTNPTVAAGMGLVINGGAVSPRIALKNTNSGDASTDGFQIVFTTQNEAVLENRELGAIRLLTNGSERMRITSGSNIGIGTVAPATLLHISGTFSDLMRIEGSSTGNNTTYYSAVNGSGDMMQVGIANAGYSNALYPTITTRGAYLYSPRDLGIIAESGFNILFQTSGSERMRITSAGNVGIGTSSPTTLLHVSGSSSIIIPVGTTAQRNAVSSSGMIRINSTFNKLEFFNNSTWNVVKNEPVGTYSDPITDLQAFDQLNRPEGTYYFRPPNNTATSDVFQMYYRVMAGNGFVRVFSSPYNDTATVNLINLSIPLTQLLVQRDNGDFRTTAGWNDGALRYFNTRNTTGDLTTTGDRIGSRIYFGYPGGHGIYNTTQLVCSWSNVGTGAVGAGYDGAECGTFPNGLRWGTSTNTANYDNRSGTWELWLRW